MLPKASGGTTNVQVIPYGMTAIREKLNPNNTRVVHNIAPGLVMDNTGIIEFASDEDDVCFYKSNGAR